MAGIVHRLGAARGNGIFLPVCLRANAHLDGVLGNARDVDEEFIGLVRLPHVHGTESSPSDRRQLPIRQAPMSTMKRM